MLLLTTAGQAAVTISFSGGTGGTPLVANVTVGDSFTATESHSATLFIIFQNIFDNSTSSTASGTTGTATLAGTAFNGTSGAIDNALLNHGDLVLGVLSSTVTAGVPFTISTGTITTGNLSLNYSSVNAAGNIIFLKSASTQLTGASGTYVVVPEPATYACVMGLGLIGIGTVSRMKRRSS